MPVFKKGNHKNPDAFTPGARQPAEERRPSTPASPVRHSLTLAHLQGRTTSKETNPEPSSPWMTPEWLRTSLQEIEAEKQAALRRRRYEEKLAAETQDLEHYREYRELDLKEQKLREKRTKAQNRQLANRGSTAWKSRNKLHADDDKTDISRKETQRAMALERLAPEPKVSVFEPDTPSTPGTPAPGAPRLPSLNFSSRGLLSPSPFEPERQSWRHHLSSTTLSPRSTRSPRSSSSAGRLEADSGGNRGITVPAGWEARNQGTFDLKPQECWTRRPKTYGSLISGPRTVHELSHNPIYEHHAKPLGYF